VDDLASRSAGHRLAFVKVYGLRILVDVPIGGLGDGHPGGTLATIDALRRRDDVREVWWPWPTPSPLPAAILGPTRSPPTRALRPRSTCWATVTWPTGWSSRTPRAWDDWRRAADRVVLTLLD